MEAVRSSASSAVAGPSVSLGEHGLPCPSCLCTSEQAPLGWERRGGPGASLDVLGSQRRLSVPPRSVPGRTQLCPSLPSWPSGRLLARSS